MTMQCGIQMFWIPQCLFVFQVADQLIRGVIGRNKADLRTYRPKYPAQIGILNTKNEM
jgi:hypothetical protein